jgi:hypothetical protein
MRSAFEVRRREDRPVGGGLLRVPHDHEDVAPTFAKAAQRAHDERLLGSARPIARA